MVMILVTNCSSLQPFRNDTSDCTVSQTSNTRKNMEVLSCFVNCYLLTNHCQTQQCMLHTNFWTFLSSFNWNNWRMETSDRKMKRKDVRDGRTYAMEMGLAGGGDELTFLPFLEISEKHKRTHFLQPSSHPCQLPSLVLLSLPPLLSARPEHTRNTGSQTRTFCHMTDHQNITGLRRMRIMFMQSVPFCSSWHLSHLIHHSTRAQTELFPGLLIMILAGKLLPSQQK